MNKGDLVIVPFPFTDLSSQKRRPACVLSTTDQDVVLAFITTKLFYKSEYSVRLVPSEKNGLKKESSIRIDKLVTLDKKLVIGKLGEIGSEQRRELNNKMVDFYQLNIG
jgi:mRNA interferase MazF